MLSDLELRDAINRDDCETILKAFGGAKRSINDYICLHNLGSKINPLIVELASGGKNRTLESVLKFPTINVNIKNNLNGDSALIMAVFFNNKIGTLLLLQHPNINKRLTNKVSRDALSYAREKSSAFMIKALGGTLTFQDIKEAGLVDELKQFPSLSGYLPSTLTPPNVVSVSTPPNLVSTPIPPKTPTYFEQFVKFLQDVISETGKEEIPYGLVHLFKSNSWLSLIVEERQKCLDICLMYALSLEKIDLQTFFIEMTAMPSNSYEHDENIQKDPIFKETNKINAFTLLAQKKNLDPDQVEKQLKILLNLPRLKTSPQTNLIDAVDKYGKTGLVEAILSKNDVGVVLFLQYGAEPECRYQGMSCFEIAKDLCQSKAKHSPERYIFDEVQAASGHSKHFFDQRELEQELFASKDLSALEKLKRLGMSKLADRLPTVPPDHNDNDVPPYEEPLYGEFNAMEEAYDGDPLPPLPDYLLESQKTFLPSESLSRLPTKERDISGEKVADLDTDTKETESPVRSKLH